MNVSDSERIAGYLEDLGYKSTIDRDKADVMVATTCGIRQAAENRIYGIVPKVKKHNPKSIIVLTGCLTGREDVRKRLKDSVDIWLPIIDLPKLGEMLDHKRKGAGSLSGYLKLNPKYQSEFSALVPIGNGCNNFCTYCVVPYARGREEYRPAEEILKEVKGLVERGYREITLIAQNVNSYKSVSRSHPLALRALPLGQREIKFMQLLKMINDIPGNFWIRFSTSHPKDMSLELIESLPSLKKVCEHIHLPVQAGDNRVLAAMNRKYTVEHYLDLVDKIRSVMPSGAISTDVIVGFPGEKKSEFNNTAKLFRRAEFDMAYISQYSARPGTAASQLKDDITSEEKHRREDELNKILSKTAKKNNAKYLNSEVEVLIDGHKGEVYYGKTRTMKNVIISKVKKDKIDIGEFAVVKINAVKDFGLYADFIRLAYPVK